MNDPWGGRQPLSCHPSRKRVVLLGAGHAHLEAIRRAGAFTRRGIDLVVVAENPYWYSGLATGMLGGFHQPEDDQIDVAALVERGGGTFLDDRVATIDRISKTVELASGPALSYGVLSLGLGSEVPVASVEGLAERVAGEDRSAIAAKPIANLWRLRQEVEARLERARRAGERRTTIDIVVIGGGVTACEIAANVLGLIEREGTAGLATVTLIARAARLVESWPARAAAIVGASLQRRGATLRAGTTAVRLEGHAVVTADGRRVPYDLVVAALGLAPSRLIAGTGLPTNRHGALLVDESLRSVGDPQVFGGGDCIAIGDRELPRVGVYGVRQAPILAHNLLATLEGRPLRRFRPQRRFLLIMNLGDGTALAVRGGWVWHGRIALWLKDWIDRRYVAKYR